jgi:prevent-host-death family protein
MAMARGYYRIEIATSMKSISAKELKNRTGDVLRRVGRGEKMLVTKRGKPCALLSPIEKDRSLRAQLRPYNEAWEDIQKALRINKPRHKTWEEAIQWSRRRV